MKTMKPKGKIPTLLEIKAMAKHETSGSKIMPRFYDFMEGNDDYMFNLDRCTDDNILDMVHQLAKNVLRVKDGLAIIGKAVYLEKRADNFFHGQFFMAAHLVSYFYFDDLKIGCMALASQKGRPMIYIRFDGDFLRNRLN